MKWKIAATLSIILIVVILLYFGVIRQHIIIEQGVSEGKLKDKTWYVSTKVYVHNYPYYLNCYLEESFSKTVTSDKIDSTKNQQMIKAETLKSELIEIMESGQ